MPKYIPKVAPEPIWDESREASIWDFTNAFAWYNENKSSKDTRKYLIDYLVNTNQISDLQLQAAQYLNDSWHTTDAKMARCISRGAKPDALTLNKFNFNLSVFLGRLDAIIKERSLDEKKKNTENIVSIQERIQNKADYYIMELEAKFDDLWHKNSGEQFVPYTWMVENDVKPVHASKIAEYFRARVKDWLDMIDARKTDEYVKESYPRSTKEYQQGASILTMFVEDADKLADNKKASRKPRKKKPVSFEKKVKNLNYKKDDIENKLVSIDPIKILGADKLWIFNIKTRKLGVYIAADAAGLDVKGSTIQNYKYSESVSKTLRKPTETLPRVLDGGKVVLRKVMGEINSKPQELNGRINKDTILLRVE